MKLRTLLPIAQVILAGLVLFGAFEPKLKYSGFVVDPVTGERHFNIDMRDFSGGNTHSKREWAMMFNLPGGIVELPVELAVTKGHPSTEQMMKLDVARFWGFSVIGTVFWWLAGRFLDDAIAFIRKQPFNTPSHADSWFGVVALPVPIILCIGMLTFTPDDWRDFRFYVPAAVIWSIVAVSAIAFRFLQWRGKRREASQQSAAMTATSV